ncbi:SAM-dependent DNA methyltransferase [Arthrobacter sp. NPDC092385]|uniref:SAM-dependent DNA methyltransferase n=1 Tax=Arthrobacter sp. NPDC092385 TaxID=3363943 RepID=UPI00132B0CE0|nr:GcrY protein [Vibrio cholerae]
MQTLLDRATIRTDLGKFSHRWRGRIDGWEQSGQAHTEKSFAQQLWSDLLRCFGVIPERIDLFERDATRASTGGTGYIDFFWSGVAIGEAKSLGKDLDKAHKQALDYLAGGSVKQFEYPKHVMVTDFENFRIDRMGEEPWTIRFTIDQIADHVDQLMFLAGHETVTKTQEEEASIAAAQLMAQLYNALVGDNADEAVGDDAPTNIEEEDQKAQEASVLLTRLLFLLFGDDAGLWEEDLFRRWVEFDTTASNLGPQLDALFRVLDMDPSSRRNIPESLNSFPHVNGALFDSSMPAGFLPEAMREALLDACRFRWTQISPAVFGAMFQLIKSKQARRGDGEHYTSETNILKTIGPLFLDDYRQRADRLIAAQSTTLKALNDLQDELASNLYVDPACGAGNFLNVAYAKLRDIETDLIAARHRKQGGMDRSLDATIDQRLSIDQFWGIEINWWPAKIAETAMFLVDHQANRRLAAAIGQAPDRLPIRITAHIVHHNALTLNWSQTLPEPDGQTFVFGNPPFIGQYTKTTVQTEDMKAVWGDDYNGYLDYVTAWHAQTKTLLADRYGEFAFVTTNSIAQGQPVGALFGSLARDGWRIKFAHRTFKWDSEAPGKAGVHCVIVGFTRDRSSPQKLWDYPDVRGEAVLQKLEHGINAYLIDERDIVLRKERKPVSPVIPAVSYGSKPTDGGYLALDAKEGKAGLDEDAIARKYLRKFVGAKETLHNIERWCLWLTDLTPADRRNSAALSSRIESVRQMRLASRKQQTQESANTPHLFQEIRQPTEPYLCIPIHVSENRKYWTALRFDADIICGNANFLAADKDGLLFALISSSMFMSWQRVAGGRLESRYRFANTLTWNTFPVPELSDRDRQRIIAGGDAVLQARALQPGQSLADMYDPLSMAPELLAAHNALDKAVDQAFGSSRRIRTEKQRLEVLFAHYRALVSAPTPLIAAPSGDAPAE